MTNRELSTILEDLDEDQPTEIREARRRLLNHEVDLDTSFSEDVGSFRPQRASTPVFQTPTRPVLMESEEILDISFPDSWLWKSTADVQEQVESSGDSTNTQITLMSIDLTWNADNTQSLSLINGTAPKRLASLSDHGSPGAHTQDFGENISFCTDSYESEYEELSDNYSEQSLQSIYFDSEGGFNSMKSMFSIDRSQFFCDPFSTLPPIKMAEVWRWLPRTLKDIYQGSSNFTKLRRNWSRGKCKIYSRPQKNILSKFIAQLLFKDVICRAKKSNSFCSMPFLIPKRDNRKLRFIVDYGHLRVNKLYKAPKFSLRPILASRPAVMTLKIAKFFAKVDLREAFFSVPIPEVLSEVSTFKFEGQFYRFKRLPMGLFLSPYILQSILRTVLRGIPKSWVHIDDILLWDDNYDNVRKNLDDIIRMLHRVGFRLNTQKSILKPKSYIEYCGLSFNGKAWNLTKDKEIMLFKLLKSWPRKGKKLNQAKGFINFVLYMFGLSATWIRLVDFAWWRVLLADLFRRLPRLEI